MRRQKPLPHPALGQVICRLRTEAKLNQAELVRRSKVAYGTVWRVERGLIDPHWSTVEKLADGLGVSIGQMGREIEKQKALSREDAEKRQT